MTAMNSQQLIELLHAVLRGETQVDELVAEVERTLGGEHPETAVFLQELEAAYGRNEVRYDLYLHLKDRLLQSAPSAPEGATVLRHSPDTGSPAERTILRPAATAPATRPTPSRPRSLPAGSPSTGAGWDEVDGWAPGVEQPLEPGSIVKSRFVLEQRIGEGGMGVVFKAKDLRKEEAQDRDPSVAIKFLSSEFRKHPEALKALQRETRRAQTLAHPNIVTVYDFDRDGTLIFMTMEFLGGEPLDRFIQRHPQGVRFKEAWPIIEGAGRALMYAHEQGVVHADFKPGNVFVADGAKGRQVKVLDFGIARALVSPGDGPDEGTKFDAGSLGALTPAYASPEMLLNEDPDPRDDVYALACVAYELLTGRHPFGGVAAVRAAHEGLKVKRTPGMRRRQFKALVRGLAFKRSDRTPSVESFLDEMAGPLGVKGREMRRAILSTGFTAIAVTAIGVALWLYMRPDPDEVFVRNLMKDAKARVEQLQSTAGGLPYEPDLQARDAFISQGSDYIYLAQQPFDPGLLSEGVSSAYGAFRAALEIDPSSREAAEGILEIVRLYETEAERALEAGYFEKAAQLAAYGLKVAPGRDSLEQIRAEAVERIPAGETTRSDGGTG